MKQIIGKTIEEVRVLTDGEGVEFIFTDGTCFHVRPRVNLTVQLQAFDQDRELTAEESAAL